VQMQQGVLHFRVKGKRDKIRYIHVNPEASRLIDEYLELAGHSTDKNGPLFRPQSFVGVGKIS
jgi:integrase/recombinase XerD